MEVYRENKELLKIQWSEMEPLSPDIVKQFLADEQFSNLLVSALRNTHKNTPQDVSYFKDTDPSLWLEGREYAFLGYRYIGLADRLIHFGTLIEGEDGCIPFSHMQSFVDQHDFSRTLSFFLHTHPIQTKNERMMREIFQGDNRLSQILDHEFCSFSAGDLGFLKWLSRQEDSSAINGIAVSNLNETKGRLLLMSFNSFRSYVRFNPQAVYKKAKRYATLGKSHFDGYRESGLNVAELTVNLESYPHLDEKEIEAASLILTTRSS